MEKKRFIVGVSGASGAPLARRLLKELKKQEQVEVHLVMTDGGVRTADEVSYFLIPSTCKKDYPLYEFVMVDSKNDKRVTCQVKNTDTVDAKKYKSDFFERIYLFSGNEEYGDEDPADNMEIIQRKDLFGIIRQQFKE